MLRRTATGTEPFDIDDPEEKLAYRASLPGASGYDAAVSSLRALPRGGHDELALLPLVLPTSWMVNATATSRTFRAWREPAGQQAFGAILTLLPAGMSLEDWQELPETERVAVVAFVRALAETPGGSLAAVTKVLALLRPQLVPLMDDAALAFALGTVERPETADAPKADAAHFAPMLDWLATQHAREARALQALAKSHEPAVLDSVQVLDRLLWVVSWGDSLRGK